MAFDLCTFHESFQTILQLQPLCLCIVFIMNIVSIYIRQINDMYKRFQKHPSTWNMINIRERERTFILILSERVHDI